MRQECQSLLDEGLYTQIGEWSEEIDNSRGLLEQKMHAWRVTLPSSPESEDLLWDHLREFPWKQAQHQQLLETLLPPTLDLKSWKTVDRRTGQVVSAVRYWKKTTKARRHKSVVSWKKSIQSTATLELARRLLNTIDRIIRETTEQIHPRVFTKHWAQTELLFASLSHLDTSTTF